jgi:hypothetical protein
MASGTFTAASTPTLLLGSLLAGPTYMAVSLAQAFTQPAFDITRHPLSLLTQGDLGWLQIANFIFTGLLIVAGAVGIRRSMSTGIGRFWGPLLIGIFGASFVGAGLFRPDPAMGFPAGTPADAMAISSTGIAHFAIGGIGFLSIIVACFVVARRFGTFRDHAWTIYSVLTGVIFLAAFLGIMSGAGKSWSLIAFLIGVTFLWSWLTLLSAKLRAAMA